MKHKQLEGARLICLGLKHKHVAQRVGVTAQTVSVWCGQAEFNDVVAKLKVAALNARKDEMRQLMQPAVATLRGLLFADKDQIRLKAALAVLELGGFSSPDVFAQSLADISGPEEPVSLAAVAQPELGQPAEALALSWDSLDSGAVGVSTPELVQGQIGGAESSSVHEFICV